ncbi:hypothetical protein [Xanthovirga aplysinae]|uniref:hypothetical protein n=1 Tax=Xanthovirga aplysinae TaxID=2529853 RepID=UPI0012BC6A79|nr:hypothetical protein [Xanthovirga aplysinae]MTI29491.1 hypothetical protein [Xanthovirga aplysinae]
MTKLLSLKVPRGWAILDNKFFDVDPIKADNDDWIVNWYEGFIEDVLWIDECQILEGGKMGIPNTNYFNIDLGWYPDSSKKGKYTLRLNWVSTEGAIEIDYLSDKDRFIIKEKLEYWLEDIKKNYSKYKPKIEQ